MNKTIFTIEYEIPGHSELKLDYSSRKSLMDADIILFNPKIPCYEKEILVNGLHNGKACYSQNGSYKLEEDMGHWKMELASALRNGKTIFLLLNSKEEFYNYVSSFDKTKGNSYEFVPLTIGTITSSNGSHIEPVGNPLFRSLFEKFKQYFEYRVYLDNLPESTIIFTGKDKSKILGAVYKVGAGHLIALPYLNNDDRKFTEYRGETGFWTKEAGIFGENLINCLLDIDKGLHQEMTKTHEPDWVSKKEFCSKKEQKITESISTQSQRMEKIKKDVDKLENQLIEEKKLKDLLYEQGKPLEEAVTKALKILGYSAENYDDGVLEMDQVIISPEKIRYIGECEGKDNKDIDITKLRQLMDSLSEDFDRDEVEEKALGILFGNPERLKDPKLRKLDFTTKCKSGAKREKVALVKTVDLFLVAKYLTEKKDDKFKKACRNAIHSCLGEIVKFPDIPKE